MQFAPTVQGDRADDKCFRFFCVGDRFVHGGQKWPRADRVYGDFVICEFERKGSRQLNDGAFAGGVWGSVG